MPGRRAAIVGGNRIPFARSNGRYAQASNQDMLTAALDGLVARFGLAGVRLGEVVAGAVLKHSRDFNLTRETVLGSRLDPHTPAYDVQQACGTGLEAAILVANKIALGQIEAGIAGGVDTTSDAPLQLNEDFRRALLQFNAARSVPDRLRALAKIRPAPAVPARCAAQRRATHRAVHGRARRDHRAALGHRAGGAGRARAGVAPQARGGLRRRLLRRSPHALSRADPRPEPAARHHDGKAGHTQAGVRRHDDRGQLVAADRRSVHCAPRLRRVGRRAQPAGARPFRRRRDRSGRLRPRRRGAVDGAGVRRAAVARPQRADAAGLRLLRDPRGVRVAGPRDAGGVGVAGVLQGQARARRHARVDRPRQAQRQRLVAGRRAPVRGDRRTDRGHARQAARPAGSGPWARSPSARPAARASWRSSSARGAARARRRPGRRAARRRPRR